MEPFNFSDSTRRQRRFLLIASVLALLMGFFESSIEKITLAGVQLSAMGNHAPLVAKLTLMAIVIYGLIYFVWSARIETETFILKVQDDWKIPNLERKDKIIRIVKSIRNLTTVMGIWVPVVLAVISLLVLCLSLLKGVFGSTAPVSTNPYLFFV